MPTDSLMPKKKSGSAGYIIAALLMFGAMGGLIFWKLSSGQAEPEKKAEIPTPTPTKEVPEFEAPPPPPPPAEDLEDAGDEEKPKKVAKAGGGNWGCNAKQCNGTASAGLKSALRGKAGQARGCYERALRNNSMLSGRLVVGVRIGPQGQVCSAGVSQTTLGDPSVASCVLQMFRSGSFPPPSGGCVDTQVPMNFVPKT